MTTIEVRPVKTKQELEDMYHQRWLVLREPMGMEKGTEQDKYDSSAFHLVAVCNNQVIGSARLRELSPGLGSIAYVALLPEFRHQGIGTKLMETLIEKAKANNFNALRLLSRINALGFYSRLGFIADGDQFDYVGISHQFMYLNISSQGNREQGVGSRE
ncbi:MAG: GNAT family N-acetyltransferase [Moorea sp. SIO1G6]|uniref:Putative acetyltransferase n=2 Tax=Coleofasciculaceae TaxID=1892251 RepID=F4XVK2_9CYAN|nr:putative acetyltransferase [Moorena producens 3L]NEP31984.1 GNAT family N-acetyltransferase [Moorena sp. SIO3B2]NEP70179.1 GNAT family N-acetyltransferase [Moorena sp. SIO3A5]NER92138.1 GNAT family N-acetyltransferase [Moorena sp. SIO3A2]NET63825.1 GNAT family N-acetyltransferase [Moorena sp. SIO1G6]